MPLMSKIEAVRKLSACLKMCDLPVQGAATAAGADSLVLGQLFFGSAEVNDGKIGEAVFPPHVDADSLREKSANFLAELPL